MNKLEIYQGKDSHKFGHEKIEIWVSSIFLPNLSLIGPLTTDIYYRTEITGQTNTHIENKSDTLPI